VAAAKAMGAAKGYLLEYTTSYDVIRKENSRWRWGMRGYFIDTKIILPDRQETISFLGSLIVKVVPLSLVSTFMSPPWETMILWTIASRACAPLLGGIEREEYLALYALRNSVACI